MPLDILTEDERQRVMNVLERDLEFQQNHSAYLQKLKQELDVYESINENDHSIFEPRCCHLCQQTSSRFKRLTECISCDRMVCGNCKYVNSRKPTCLYCYKKRQYLMASGEWMSSGMDCQEDRLFTSKSLSCIQSGMDESTAYFPSRSGTLSAIYERGGLESSPSVALLTELQKTARSEWDSVDTDGVPAEILKFKQNKKTDLVKSKKRRIYQKAMQAGAKLSLKQTFSKTPKLPVQDIITSPDPYKDLNIDEEEASKINEDTDEGIGINSTPSTPSKSDNRFLKPRLKRRSQSEQDLRQHQNNTDQRPSISIIN